jgi:hypothetical protein
LLLVEELMEVYVLIAEQEDEEVLLDSSKYLLD